MKTDQLKFSVLALTTCLVAAGCSSFGKNKAASGEDLQRQGPTVMNTRAIPETVELNRSYQPTQTPEILTEVKDFESKITGVTLRFVNVPLEVAMRNVAGTTWRATLSPAQVKMLAVGGQTMRYEANIVARNQNGEVAVSKEPIEISVRAPDLAESTG